MAQDDDDAAPAPQDFNECVSRNELNALVQQQTDTVSRILKCVEGLTRRLDAMEEREKIKIFASDNDPSSSSSDDSSSSSEDDDASSYSSRRRSGKGNGKGKRGGRGYDDQFARVKFKIPAFDGAYDANAYLDWEMTVEQKFNSHMVPAKHRVRHAVSEFTGYAIIWWNGVVKSGCAPTTWKRLKHAMRTRFVPPHYKRDMKKKLQRFDQGTRSVYDYYNELLVAMQRCGIKENDDDTMTRFYAGLRKDIQNLVNYKEYDSTDKLYHLAMLAEQELQDRNEQRSRLPFGNSSSSSRLPSTKGRAGQDARSRTPLARRRRRSSSSLTTTTPG